MALDATGYNRSLFLTSCLAGGTAGAFTDLILFPLDTLKTRLQLRGGAPAARGAFYRGLLSNMAGALPYATTYWSLYEALKCLLRARGLDDALVPGTAAAGAETCAMFVRNPFDVVKQQMQGHMHPTTRAAIARILRAEGPRGFWVGYGATLCRDVPFAVVQFSLLEFGKRWWRARYGHEPTVQQVGFMGSAAAAVAGGVTAPLDVVRTRLMTQTGAAAGEGYRGFPHALQRIHAEEGAGAFFRGGGTRIAWLSIGGFIFLGSYEGVRRALAPHFGGRAGEV